jgi:hypothetical protein
MYLLSTQGWAKGEASSGPVTLILGRDGDTRLLG